MADPIATRLPNEAQVLLRLSGAREQLAILRDGLRNQQQPLAEAAACAILVRRRRRLSRHSTVSTFCSPSRSQPSGSTGGTSGPASFRSRQKAPCSTSWKSTCALASDGCGGSNGRSKRVPSLPCSMSIPIPVPSLYGETPSIRHRERSRAHRRSISPAFSSASRTSYAKSGAWHGAMPRHSATQPVVSQGGSPERTTPPQFQSLTRKIC